MTRARLLAVTTVAAVFLAAAAPGFAWGWGAVKGSGKIVSETRTLDSFDRLGSAGSATVVVTVGPAQSVTVKADDNVVSLIETKVENGRLKIGTNGSYSTDSDVTVTVTVPALKAAALSGSGDLTVTGVGGDSFEAALSGSGDISATGRAEKISVSVAGSGDVHLFGLASLRAEVSIAGSGDVEVSATEALSASIAGSGDVHYRGKPAVKRSIAGSGDVRPAPEP